MTAEYACPCGHTTMELPHDPPEGAVGHASVSITCDRCLGLLSYPQQPNYDPREQS